MFALLGCAGNTELITKKPKAAATITQLNTLRPPGAQQIEDKAAPGPLTAKTEAPECVPNKDILPGTDLSPKVDDVRAAAIEELLKRIATCQPLLYYHDGIVFANKENLLPARTAGYYHEYTLAIPGRKIGDSPEVVNVGTQTFTTGEIFSPRGPERIIVGSENELFYTPDHYSHFVELHIVR